MGRATLSSAVRRFLEVPRFATLATLNRDGSPHLTAIWYELSGEDVLFNTTTTRVKSRNIARDPRVSLLVGDMATYVRIDGAARSVATGSRALDDIRRLAIRYDGPAEAERLVREVWSKQERVSYAISISHVYAYEIE